MQVHEEETEPLVMASDILKVVSWHISSLQKAFENGLRDFIKLQSPDIICLQIQHDEANTKTALNQEKGKYLEIGSVNDQFQIEGYKGYIIPNFEPNDAHGKDEETAMFTKIKPIKVSRTDYDEDENKKMQASNEKNDSSIMTIEFTNFYIVNAIAPDRAENDVIIEKWYEKLQKLLTDLDSQKTTIVCGDFKVAHQDLDIVNSNNNEFNYYEDSKNKKRFSDFLSDSYVDIFRKLYPSKQQFSYFASASNKPGENKSKCRIDYFIAQNEAIETKIVVDCSIEHIEKSKHSPIVLLLDREKLISTEHDLLVDSLSSDEKRNEILFPFGIEPTEQSKEETKSEQAAGKESNSNEVPNTNDYNEEDENILDDFDSAGYNDDYDENDENESSDENEEAEINGHKIRKIKGRFFDFSRQAVRGGKNKASKKDDDEYAPIKRPNIRSKPKAKKNTNTSSEPHRGRGRPRKVKPEEK